MKVIWRIRKSPKGDLLIQANGHTIGRMVCRSYAKRLVNVLNGVQ